MIKRWLHKLRLRWLEWRYHVSDTTADYYKNVDIQEKKWQVHSDEMLGVSPLCKASEGKHNRLWLTGPASSPLLITLRNGPRHLTGVPPQTGCAWNVYSSPKFF